MDGSARVQRFEDLVAWQKARRLASEIYAATASGAFGRDWGLRDQIRRAAVSAMSNIAEGFERAGRAEFHQFLVIAKGSCAEVRSQLYVARDVGHLSEQEFRRLRAVAEEVTRVISGLRTSIDPGRSRLRAQAPRPSTSDIASNRNA